MAQQNIETFTRYDVKKIVTICPHCFNTIKNEYPHLGGNYQVLHYSEFVADLIADGKLKPLVTIDTTLTYHDSCYLGRHNGVYDAPREIAEAIPGLQLREMEKCRDRAFCCGAGGGHMWMDESRGRRINHIAQTRSSKPAPTRWASPVPSASKCSKRASSQASPHRAALEPKISSSSSTRALG